MHEIAEYGIAAHTLYKDSIEPVGEVKLSPKSNAYSWLRRTIESLDAKEIIRRTSWSTPSSNCSRIRCSALRRKVS